MAVGALERKFHQELFESQSYAIFLSILLLELGLDMEQLMSDPAKAVEQLEKTFRSKTRDEWSMVFEGAH